MDRVLALDIGGTKIAAALAGRDGSLGHVERMPTPRSPDPEVVFAAVLSVCEKVMDAEREFEPVACGVGCGGPMRQGASLVSPVNIPAWRDFPLRERLADALGISVHVDNDAKALALGEGWQGTAKGKSHYMAMVVSTGVGGGIVLDGRLLDGREGNAGHVGHIIVEPEGHPCGCGAVGCLEAEASGTAISKIFGCDPAEAPMEVRRRSGLLVGRAVASVANLLDIEIVVVAGSVALGYGDVFFASAREELERRARLDHSRGVPVVPSVLGATGPLVGAAAVAWRGVGAIGE
ncbi:MAG: sugar kinase [Acidimicrobiales bacterium]|nr:MAG: sugar kinase [Acidimicrobiales bacterium]